MLGCDEEKFAQYCKVVFTFSDEPEETAGEFIQELCNPTIEEEGKEPTPGTLTPPGYYFVGKNTETDTILG